MANRSIKVRQVFAELRQALGAEIPAGELLRLAAALVDASSPGEAKDPHQSLDPRPAYDQVPLDKAFADDGWAIMRIDPRLVADAYGDDDPSFTTRNFNIAQMEMAA